VFAFVVPGRLDTRSGGSIYNRRIVEGLRAAGQDVRVVEVHGRVPGVAPETSVLADAAFAGLDEGTITVVDGLLFGGIPDVAAAHASRLRLVALVHLPLAAEPGLAEGIALARRDTEVRALRAARHVVITGTATRALLNGYDVADARLTVVEPGTDRPDANALASARARRARREGSVRLLAVGTVNAGKGHERLVRALALTGRTSWHLTIAGSLTRHRAAADALRGCIAELACGNRVTLAGDLSASELAEAYADADVFALATERETYGMAVADALAWELPVVGTRTGAIPALVGETAGIVVPAGDDDRLRSALASVLDHAHLRAAFAKGARDAADRLPSWHDQAAAFARVLDTLA